MTVHVSTGGFAGLTACESVEALLAVGISEIELSGGRWSPTALENLIPYSEAAKLVPHNYFPPPEIPFVFNLGSLDTDIQRLSVQHVRQSMNWCKQLGVSVFSFHAGFLIDPTPSELGQKIQSRQLFDRQKSIDTFVKLVKQLAVEAGDLGVQLMVENNVVSQQNFDSFNGNPLLMADPQECEFVLSLLPSSVGLLLDVAHLKVSATTLKFPIAEIFDRCENRIAGYHLSENDGLSDSNGRLSVDDWYWEFINPLVDYFSIEVYGESCETLLQQQLLVKEKLAQLNESLKNDA